MSAGDLSWSIDVTSGSSSPPPSKYTVPVERERSIDGSGSLIDADSTGATITRRWEGARTDRLNSAHWSDANGEPLDSSLAWDLPTLQARSAYEYHNNPLVEGLVETHATDIVGPEGPTLQVLSSDDRFNTRAESRWGEWTEICDRNGEAHLDEILRTWVRSIWHTGAWLGQEVTDDTGSSFPAMMRLLDVHATRLETPWSMSSDKRVAFGVRRDNGGRALEYYVKELDFFGAHAYETGNFDRLPPEVVYHDFIRTESGQTVGYPLLAAALPTIAQLRDYDQSVLDAAQMAADRSGWFVNVDPNGEKYEPEDSKKLETTHRRMTTRAAPPGWDYRNVDAKHPTASYVEHRRERMAELGRSAAMPLMLIRLDSSDHNYSSARFDHQSYCWHVKSWQRWLRKKILMRLVRKLMRELSLAGDIPAIPPDVRYQWNWPPPPQGDPVKERAAERMGLQNRTLTFSAACRQQDLNEDDVIESWKATFDKFVAVGFSRDEAMQMINIKPGGPNSRQPNAARPGNDPSNRPQSEKRSK